MKINVIDAIPIELPYKTPYRTPYGVVTSSAEVIVRVRTDDGLEGVGVAFPHPYKMYADSVPNVMLAVQEIIAPTLVGIDASNIRLVHKVLDGLITTGAGRAAKNAVDQAVHDIAGKALGVPVSTLLGGALRDRILVNPMSVGRGSPAEAAEMAREAVEKGHQAFKLKSMENPFEDVERLAAVAEVTRKDVQIRLDPNEQYSKTPLKTVIRAVRQMETYGLSILESPLHRTDLQGYAQLCSSVEVPIAVHQGNEGPEFMANLIRMRAADVFNIAVGLVGGILPAVKMLGIAESFGIPVFMGGAGCTGIETAASAHVAAVAADLPYASDCRNEFPVGRVVDDVLAEPHRYEDGFLLVPEGPGLGVEIDEDKLGRYRSD